MFYAVGPLDVRVNADRVDVREPIARSLSLFDVSWPFDGVQRAVTLDIAVAAASPAALAADPALPVYLETGNLVVERTSSGIRATTRSGTVIRGDFDADGERWSVTLAETSPRQRLLDLDDSLTLALSTGWRRAGWSPLHAAAVVRDGRGVIILAQGGGGKTSTALSLVSRGWFLVGDDKVLVGWDSGRLLVAAVQHWLHLDPESARWLPGLKAVPWDDLEPELGPKRRVQLQAIWPARGVTVAAPATVLVVERPAGARGVAVEEMGSQEVLLALLRQTAIPADPPLAAQIGATMAAVARSSRGWRVAVGHEALSEASAVDALEAVLT